MSDTFEQPKWGMLDYIPAKRLTMEELVKAWVNPAWYATDLIGHIKDMANELTQVHNELSVLQLTAQQPAPAQKKTGLQMSLDNACAIIVNQEEELKQLRAQQTDTLSNQDKGAIFEILLHEALNTFRDMRRYPSKESQVLLSKRRELLIRLNDIWFTADVRRLVAIFDATKIAD